MRFDNLAELCPGIKLILELLHYTGTGTALPWETGIYIRLYSPKFCRHSDLILLHFDQVQITCPVCNIHRNLTLELLVCVKNLFSDFYQSCPQSFLAFIFVFALLGNFSFAACSLWWGWSFVVLILR